MRPRYAVYVYPKNGSIYSSDQYINRLETPSDYLWVVVAVYPNPVDQDGIAH